jgi:hypothetical protein
MERCHPGSHCHLKEIERIRAVDLVLQVAGIKTKQERQSVSVVAMEHLFHLTIQNFELIVLPTVLSVQQELTLISMPILEHVTVFKATTDSIDLGFAKRAM